MSRYLSRHVDNDDMRHYSFTRNTGLPVDYFADPAEAVREWFVRWRWLGIAGLIAILFLLWLIGDAGSAAN